MGTKKVIDVDSTENERIAVIGGGPAGLMAADVLAGAGWAVTVYDRMPTLGRKFLLAGRGGLNLTHGEDRRDFLTRYASAAGALTPALDAFPPGALAAWCEDLGLATFVGSSGRVFPNSFKTSPLLRAWLRRLETQGVRVAPRHRWLGWDTDDALLFETADGSRTRVTPRVTVLALGGASWPRLGADGGWVPVLRDAGIAVRDLVPANTGCEIAWSPVFRERFAGSPLKRIAVSVAGDGQGATVLGEAMVTARGLEGGAIYAISAHVRGALAAGIAAEIYLDLRPDVSLARLIYRLQAPRGKQSQSNYLRKATGLAPVAISLLREGNGNQPLPTAPDVLADLIKALPLRVTGLGGLDRAISSAGGVRFEDLDADAMLRARPGVFVAGEMLDWEAPTGGYLLQACFATGHAAARGALRWLGRPLPKTEPPDWALPAHVTTRVPVPEDDASEPAV